MRKLVDSFVDWFNGLFGLEYAGYDWIIALAAIFVAAVVFYFILKAAIRPLVPLFTAEHAKINAHLPDIEKGVREAHRRSRTSPQSPEPAIAAFEEGESESLEMESADLRPAGASRPFIHILPMEDFNHASEAASKLAGLLADGLAETLHNIPQVEVARTRVDDDLEGLLGDRSTRYTVTGTVEPRDDDMSVSMMVRDAALGQCIFKSHRTSSYDKMPSLEREFAAEIASAVLMHDRQRSKNTLRLVSSQKSAGQSGSTYPSDRRPSPALPRKTRRPVA